MEFNTEDIGWPHDTEIFGYPSLAALLFTVKALSETGHVFVVSPKYNSIAMSAAAAREIGVIW